MQIIDVRPWPKSYWLLIALAIPTFYMPLAYVTAAVWVMHGFFSHHTGDMPTWMFTLVHPSLYVTLALWPVYVVWAGLSGRLNRHEKGWWLFIVFFMNMIGMPMFFVFMVRRYLGLEAAALKRDGPALDAFLQRCGVKRESLTDTQADVLRTCCRRDRKNRLCAWFLIPLCAFGIYFAAVLMPDAIRRMNIDQIPMQTIVVDSVKHSKKEIGGTPEVQHLFIDNVLMECAQIGILGCMSLFILINMLMQAWGSPDRRTLIAFLRASQEHPL